MHCLVCLTKTSLNPPTGVAHWHKWMFAVAMRLRFIQTVRYRPIWIMDSLYYSLSWHLFKYFAFIMNINDTIESGVYVSIMFPSFLYSYLIQKLSEPQKVSMWGTENINKDLTYEIKTQEISCQFCQIYAFQHFLPNYTGRQLISFWDGFCISTDLVLRM